MNKHSLQSSYREKLIEHLFIGELLKLSWKLDDCQLEIARPEVDNSGYDIIAHNGNILRYIQFKTSFVGASTNKQKINQNLSEKQSGCVVWIFFDHETLSSIREDRLAKQRVKLN